MCLLQRIPLDDRLPIPGAAGKLKPRPLRQVADRRTRGAGGCKRLAQDFAEEIQSLQPTDFSLDFNLLYKSLPPEKTLWDAALEELKISLCVWAKRTEENAPTSTARRFTAMSTLRAEGSGRLTLTVETSAS